MLKQFFLLAFMLVSCACEEDPPYPPAPPSTPDTTSHDILWKVDTLGDGASSVLYDVAILDTTVLAVGEVNKRDSVGNWETQPYGLAKLNGLTWELERVLYQGMSVASHWILVFGKNDIWLSDVAHWNGDSWEFPFIGEPVFAGIRTHRGWGTSSSDFYVAGDGGFVAHYDGQRWMRMVSGTTTNINDIFGRIEESTRRRRILLACSSRYHDGDKKLLSINDSDPLRIDTLSWEPAMRIQTVWFASNPRVYAGGSGLYFGTPGAWRQVVDLPGYYVTCLRGTADNDVWVVGAYGLCAHFNGATWRVYSEVALADGSYEGLAVSSKLVVAVGYVNGRAIALCGKR